MFSPSTVQYCIRLLCREHVCVCIVFCNRHIVENIRISRGLSSLFRCCTLRTAAWNTDMTSIDHNKISYLRAAIPRKKRKTSRSLLGSNRCFSHQASTFICTSALMYSVRAYFAAEPFHLTRPIQVSKYIFTLSFIA